MTFLCFVGFTLSVFMAIISCFCWYYSKKGVTQRIYEAQVIAKNARYRQYK